MEQQVEPVEYVILLERPRFTFINLVSQLLLLLFLASFFYYIFQTGQQNNFWLYLIPAMIGGLWIFGYVRGANPQFMVYYRLELMIAAIGWISMMQWPVAPYIGLAYAVMAAAERIAKMPDELLFSEESVVRHRFPRKRYEWVQIENVIIRDNLFTLDLRNNTFIQKPLEQSISPELEQEFNAWCKKQLHFQAQQ
ncbi:MAG TPA: hypothetical protein PKD90_01185 [Phnomibacter sp.]|nr:hypothetical protein [Phnomibacter sp.]